MRYRIFFSIAIFPLLASGCGPLIRSMIPYIDKDWSALSYVDTDSGLMPIMTDITPEEGCAVKATEAAFLNLKKTDPRYGFLRPEIKGGYLFIRNPEQVIPRICEPTDYMVYPIRCVNHWKDVPSIWGGGERVSGEGYGGIYIHYVFVSRIGDRAPFDTLLQLTAHERSHEIAQRGDGKDLNILAAAAYNESRKLIMEYYVTECVNYLGALK